MKSAAAFRTISEVSDELAVPQHVLRFWESKFPQIKPLKRGGGRRYYRPEDVDLLKRVSRLLYHEGYTIRGVQRLLREGALKSGRKGDAVEPALPFDLEEEAEAESLFYGFAEAPETEEEGAGQPGIDPAWEAPEPKPKRLPAATRQVLEAVLRDLEDLRALLPRSSKSNGSA
ncbi:MAG TPA: MerR family transcriptional regulator [Stellaceae bacterium]|nr:MerR family transcriptional regulator [Stellaceae bacterium]